MKQYIKRLCKYIISGTPQISITPQIVQISHENSLKGKTILITGGNRGLGLSIAKKCISEGAKVLITGRDKKELENAKEMLGINCHYLQFDVSKVDQIEEFMRQAIDLMGEIDCLVNNAGVSLHEKGILDVTEKCFDTQMNINLKGGYFIAKEFIKYRLSLEAPKSSNIVFISSERGFQCDDLPYGLTKTALNSLTKGLSRRFYRNGIRVNAIAPGVTATSMTGIDASKNMYAKDQVAERYFLPEEVAEVVCFILSDASKCISGEVIACDAGQYICSYIK